MVNKQNNYCLRFSIVIFPTTSCEPLCFVGFEGLTNGPDRDGQGLNVYEETTILSLKRLFLP